MSLSGFLSRVSPAQRKTKERNVREKLTELMEKCYQSGWRVTSPPEPVGIFPPDLIVRRQDDVVFFILVRESIERIDIARFGTESRKAKVVPLAFVFNQRIDQTLQNAANAARVRIYCSNSTDHILFRIREEKISG